MIDSILELTKIDTGTLVMDYSECGIEDIIHRSVDMFKEKAKKHRIALHVEIGEGLQTFTVDARKIKYVLVNLLTNALKSASDGGKVCVSVRKVSAQTDNEGKEPQGLSAGFVQIAVDDTGPVISEEERHYLFTPFYDHTKSGVEGANESLRISLALCKRFIELHGGNIWIEHLSVEGLQTAEICRVFAKETGNRFVFVLPARVST